jgi:hypothetical protein
MMMILISTETDQKKSVACKKDQTGFCQQQLPEAIHDLIEYKNI